jgi:hypothetical protein
LFDIELYRKKCCGTGDYGACAPTFFSGAGFVTLVVTQVLGWVLCAGTYLFNVTQNTTVFHSKNIQCCGTFLRHRLRILDKIDAALSPALSIFHKDEEKKMFERNFKFKT